MEFLRKSGSQTGEEGAARQGRRELPEEGLAVAHVAQVQVRGTSQLWSLPGALHFCLIMKDNRRPSVGFQEESEAETEAAALPVSRICPGTWGGPMPGLVLGVGSRSLS